MSLLPKNEEERLHRLDEALANRIKLAIDGSFLDSMKGSKEHIEAYAKSFDMKLSLNESLESLQKRAEKPFFSKATLGTRRAILEALAPFGKVNLSENSFGDYTFSVHLEEIEADSLGSVTKAIDEVKALRSHYRVDFEALFDSNISCGSAGVFSCEFNEDLHLKSNCESLEAISAGVFSCEFNEDLHLKSNCESLEAISAGVFSCEFSDDGFDIKRDTPFVSGGFAVLDMLFDSDGVSRVLPWSKRDSDYSANVAFEGVFVSGACSFSIDIAENRYETLCESLVVSGTLCVLNINI